MTVHVLHGDCLELLPTLSGLDACVCDPPYELGFMAREWDQSVPLLIHCWMGVSRSPAAAVVAALALYPDQDETALARRLRTVSPYATPNARIIEIGDRLLDRKGRLVSAIKAIGRGADTDGNVPFVLPLTDMDPI